MDATEKNEIIHRIITRVNLGLYFIENTYLGQHGSPDVAYIRNIYILLSFYTELLLKALFISNSIFINTEHLDQELRILGHNMQKIGAGIGKDRLRSFGINKIELINKTYHFETNVGNFYVLDFIDIRYDFLDGSVRILKGNEHVMFGKQIALMRDILNRLKV